MSKYIKQFESFQNSLRTKEKEILTKIEEAVSSVNDELRVRSIVDIQPSLINAYIKKVKDKLGKDLTQSYSKDDIAEQLVKWVVDQNLKVDKVSEFALVGGGPDEMSSSEEIMPDAPPVDGEAAPAEAPAPVAEAPEAAPAAETPAAPAPEGNPEVKTTTESLPEGEESPETAPAVEEDEDEEKEEGEDEKPETELPA